MYKVSYLPIAAQDVLDAVNYIARKLDAPKAAGVLLDELDRTVEFIARFPYASELYRTDRPMADEIRKISVKNYILYYTVVGDRVEIRRFLHSRRDQEQYL